MSQRGSTTVSKSDGFAVVLLFAIGVCHFINDTGQAIIPALYPLIKKEMHLSFLQLGLITLACQLTGAIFQPIVGLYTDRHYHPFAIVLSATSAMLGLLLLGLAHSFGVIVVAASLIGIGASIFHPEASRITHMGAGSNHGLAQSIFQVGGQAGTAFGPLFVAWFVVPHGKLQILWFSVVALVAVLILSRVGVWHHQNRDRIVPKASSNEKKGVFSLMTTSQKWVVGRSLTILVFLVFSKFLYMTSMINFYTFFLIDKFHLSIQDAQYHLFGFLISVALGVLVGGYLGDRIGRKIIIWISILGAAPFTILLPFVSLPVASILTVLIGFILSSAFSSIVIYGQELLPGNVGMISGLFFGLAFGTAGIGSFCLGILADHTSVNLIMHVCSWLPLVGILTIFLPDLKNGKGDKAT